MDIEAKEIHNQEGALLSSEGIFAIGNRLDEQHHTAGMADTFVNGSASLEVQGDALMSVRNMQNINSYFTTEGANLVLNRLTQLLMQIQCNHSQKQTEIELLRTNCKDKLTE